MAGTEPPEQTENNIPHLEEQRWKPLAQFFSGISLIDLSLLQEEDFLEAAGSRRPLMKLFILKHLQSYFESSDPSLSSREFGEILDEDPSEDKPLEVSAQLRNGRLLLAGKLTSKLFSKFASPSRPLISQIIEKLEDATMTPVITLDLARNSLSDGDIPDVKQLLEKLPKCATLKLCSNRLGLSPQGSKERTDSYSLLKDLLAHKICVDITGNALASIDCKDFFASLDVTTISQLIWIPASWLETGGWKRVLEPSMASDKLEKAVFEAHRTYYSQSH